MGIDMWNNSNSTNSTDSTDMIAALDDAMDHIDMMTALDAAFDHVEMMSALDEAFAHIDMWNNSNSTNSTDSTDMIAALDDAMDFVNKHQATDYTTPVIASAGALLAIGAGFVIKNKFSAVAAKDEEESPL